MAVNENREKGKENPRKLALDLVMQIMEKSVFCDKALHQALNKSSLEKRDRRFVTRLTQGTVERCMEMDYIINAFSKISVTKMKPIIRNILRISTYQIVYMEQVPDSAACNEAVKLTARCGMQSLKGFVNGVLRNIVRSRGQLVYPSDENFSVYASVRYSMPEWITERFLDAYGREKTEAILRAFLQEDRALSVRCMQSRFSTEQVEKSLREQGTTVCGGRLFPYALRVSNYPSVQELKAFQEGMLQVQDESSMLVGEIAGIRQGDTVLDICAAPGGKTFHAADILCGSGTVLSADLTKEKLALLAENKKRLQCGNVEILLNDAKKLRREWIAKADVVIADLPCSGLGVIGKKCDIKYKTKPEDIAELVKLQREILSIAAQYVKPGGRLIFSTCTIAREENQENVAWLTQELPFYRISIEEKLPEVFRGLTGEQGYLQVLPDQAGTDGFFVSCFERKQDIKSMDYEELQDYLLKMNQKAFRAKQIYQWLHQKLAVSFSQMTNLPKSLCRELSNTCYINAVKAVQCQTAKDGTRKFLMELSDGNCVESVLMKYKYGNSVCISTQVGCRMGCRFCASTVGGLVRNLYPSEMLDQIYEVQRITGERVSNIILMGIGEPLDNYNHVIKFIRMVSDWNGLNISQRNITVSTCGLTEQIRKLAKEKFTITLAVSLHAPNDRLRSEMMPVAERYSIREIMEACRYYLEQTKRRITFEYSLVQGKNDSHREAEELSALLKGLNCHVNLIPLNAVEGRMGQRPSRAQIEEFKSVLEKNHINVTVRRETGKEIDAACGQLRNGG